MKELLHHEDELHLDLRTLTFRFTQPRGKEPRSKETLRNFRERGSGTVLGKVDPDKEREIQYWVNVAENGITDDAVRISVQKFRVALNELNDRLQQDPYLLGGDLTVLDVAWDVYVNRLVRCGYPLEQLHPNVNRWFWSLRNRPEFDREMKVSPQIQEAVEENHRLQKEMGATLVDVAGLKI
ncbi:MAG: glutathione S-transferase C-terminal domain-containing protein [Methyloligellaceae bacterium]